MKKAIFYSIPSKTTKGKRYVVRFLPTKNEVRCSCPSFIFNGYCKHQNKKCPNCLIVKTVNCFYKDKKTGIQSWCKECQGKKIYRRIK